MAERTLNILPLALLILLSAPGEPRSAPEDASVSQVWARENDYARYIVERGTSPDKYMSLFDRRFRGWGCRSALPQDKTNVKTSISSGQLGKITSATIEREGEVAANGVVTVFYRMRTDGSNGNTISNMMHSWINDGISWKIISGMCRIDSSK